MSLIIYKITVISNFHHDIFKIYDWLSLQNTYSALLVSEDNQLVESAHSLKENTQTWSLQNLEALTELSDEIKKDESK